MVEKAMEILMNELRSKYGSVMNVRLEHTDEAGYWFSYELPQDSRRQTWCVRNGEVK